MHFWRGLAEFVAVLASAEYVHCLYYDRNTMQVLLYQNLGIFSSNSYILREVGKECEEMVNHMTPATVKELQL